MNQPIASTEALGPAALPRPRTGRFVLWALAAACAAAFLLAGASLLQWLTFAGACAFVHLASRQATTEAARPGRATLAQPVAPVAAAATALPALLPAVLPVWQRHLHDVRAQTDTAATALATSLTNINSQFDAAGFHGAGIAEGVADQREDTAISLLTLCERELLPVVATMNLLVRDKGTVAEGIHQLATATSELHEMAAGVRKIADQTNLLAINAAIQAAHAGAAGRGFGIVAKEIRNLAAVSAQTGHQIDKRVAQVSSVMKNTVQATLDAADNDKLAIELSGRVVEDVLSHVRELSGDAERMREQGTVLRGEVERLMLHLQFQDRVSQVMTAVDADMGRLADAVLAADALPPADEWLARLEQTYTMESQRQGHETGAPEPGAVEFF